MVFQRESIYDYLVLKKLPLDITSLELPVYSTVSAFRFEALNGASVTLSGKMNLKDEYTNLGLVNQVFDIVTEGSNGLFTADIGGLTYIKLSFSGDPKDIIFAFIE